MTVGRASRASVPYASSLLFVTDSSFLLCTTRRQRKGGCIEEELAVVYPIQGS